MTLWNNLGKPKAPKEKGGHNCEKTRKGGHRLVQQSGENPPMLPYQKRTSTLLECWSWEILLIDRIHFALGFRWFSKQYSSRGSSTGADRFEWILPMGAIRLRTPPGGGGQVLVAHALPDRLQLPPRKGGHWGQIPEKTP